MTPSPSLVANLRRELQRHAPFSQMSAEGVDAFVEAAEELYFAPGERILSPADGPVAHLLYVRQGSVVGRRGDDRATAFEYEAGDLFPVGALVGRRPVMATYHAEGDVFCLRVEADAVHRIAGREPAFADLLAARVRQYMELSRRALQADATSSALAGQSLEARLETLPRKTPFAVAPDTPVGDALKTMHERRIGSVLVVGADGAVAGIFTRHDVLERIALAQVPLDTPISRLMSAPVQVLGTSHTAEDAALLMSRHGIRHVPVTDEAGRLVNIVSERDLFALQRMSLKQIGGELRHAPDVDALRRLAPDIRRFARHLQAQGVSARSLTALVSHLNDALARRLVELLAREHGADLAQACWLAFGSEGRGEQTIATDQDNGIVFDSDDPERDRPRWLALGAAVNAALDACGYPLCKGGIMAGQPACCRSSAEWYERFDQWIDRGAPEDLLAVSIFFDLRPLAGAESLGQALRDHVTGRARGVPRFARQLAENALRQKPPLNWRGSIDTDEHGGIDLKLQGTALFVDVARIYALAHGIAATGTRERLLAAGTALHAPAAESESWVGAFEFLQMLRLRVQQDAASADAPNRVALASLSDIDRRMLKESLRVARRLQQRLELDYLR